MSAMPPSIPPSSPPPPGGGSYTPPPPPGGGYTPPPAGGSSDRTLMLVLSYIGLLALIPLLVKKDDREVQWHAKNGLAIFVAYIIIIIILWNIVSYFLPSSIGCALSFVGCGLWIGYLVIIVLGIMKATKGERFRVPGISDFADKM